ncbi:unnamed protein product, partial [Oppiella nova]
MIPELCDQRIRQFINGSDFVLAMNEDNHVFSWGDNHCGQCGRKATPFRVYLKPEVISDLNDKNITHICCGFKHSLALTTDGQVYGWGSYYEQYQNAEGSDTRVINSCENHYKSFFEELSDNPIGSGGFGTVFKVRHRFDEHIYAVKRIHKEDEIKNHMEVKNLVKVRSKYVVQYYNSWTEGIILYIQMELCEYNLQNILEVKLQVFGRQLGEAMDSVEYLISCEIFRQVLESVQYLHELNPQIIHRDLKPENILITLGKAMDCVEYLISCEIFRQILESVQYLHEMNPQIIHRDLKPENILIAENIRNGRFVKLCDFGLATVHDKRVHYRTTQKHTADVGDMRYIAPEVSQGGKYGHKCDIYSLALIGGNIFEIDLFNLELEDTNVYSELYQILNEPVYRLQTILISMFRTRLWHRRPECSEVLSEYNEWSIDRNILANDTRFDGILSILQSNDNHLFIELSAIGSGGFGTVFKVKHRFEEHIYAIKRVEIKDESEEYLQRFYNEVKNLIKVRSEYCVQYYNSWTEGNILYIHMELCEHNLQNILEVKQQVFDRKLGKAMDCVEYLISCEIFRQILESVQYLHEMNPQIIHRDLKPEN